MKSVHFWDAWLSAVAIMIVAFGLCLAFFSRTPLFEALHANVDPLFWQPSSMPSGALAFRTWIYALLGATMAGWGIVLVFLARNAFRKREAWAWQAVALGLAVWYLADTGMSIACGVIFNVIFNTLLVVMAGMPLFFTRREFRRQINAVTNAGDEERF